MGEWQTAGDFSQHLNTCFRIISATTAPVELELVEVNQYRDEAGHQQDVEKFSLIFVGPVESFLPQRTYRLAHEKMGELEIFLVPIGQLEHGFQYEAVFNNFKPA